MTGPTQVGPPQDPPRVRVEMAGRAHEGVLLRVDTGSRRVFVRLDQGSAGWVSAEHVTEVDHGSAE